MDLFGSKTIKMLEQSLSYSTLKQRTISNNIANVDTPNYKAKDVSFRSILDREISGGNATIAAKRTDARHINFSNLKDNSLEIKTRSGFTYNHNGNNVDIDFEMAEMAKNQIYYYTLAERMNGKFAGLKEALKGGQ